MSDSLLRRAIRLDATGVGLLGLGAAVFAGPLANLTGLTTAQCHLTAGAFLFYGIGGKAVVLACGAYTLVFGVVQFLGVRRATG